MPENEILPLRDLPVETVVDGVRVTGLIAHLWPNGIVVKMLTPVTGPQTDLHVPHFAMCPVNWLATFDGKRTVAITNRGQQRAELLLRELYEQNLQTQAGGDRPNPTGDQSPSRKRPGRP